MAELLKWSRGVFRARVFRARILGALAGLLVLFVVLSLRFLPQAFGVHKGQAVALVLLAVLAPHLGAFYLATPYRMLPGDTLLLSEHGDPARNGGLPSGQLVE